MVPDDTWEIQNINYKFNNLYLKHKIIEKYFNFILVTIEFAVITILTI